jgi:hypothetical protein
MYGCTDSAVYCMRQLQYLAPHSPPHRVYEPDAFDIRRYRVRFIDLSISLGTLRPSFPLQNNYTSFPLATEKMTLRTLPTLLVSTTIALLVTACGGSSDAITATAAPDAASTPSAPSTQPSTPIVKYATTATPYQPQQTLATYQAPPTGFSPVYTEAVVRHGSRGMSSFDASAYNMWLQAAAENALTPLGAKLGPDLLRIIKANALLGNGVQGITSPGFGNLSQTGINEETQIAARLAQRLPTYFAQVSASASTATPRQIIVSNSGVARATDSAGFFSRSLVASVPGLSSLTVPSAPLTAYPSSKPVAQAAGVNRFLLYFHKLAAKTDLVTDSTDPYFTTYNDSLTYQAYLKNTNMLAKVNALSTAPAAAANARTILEGLFTKAFVDKIDNGTYKFYNSGSFTFTSGDGNYTATVTGDNSVSIASLTDAAEELYSYYVIVPGMTNELSNLDFTQYIPDGQAAELAYLDDVSTFYEKGPGIAEDNPATYKMAQALLDDVFNEVDAIAKGNIAHAAKLRFTHAEITIPLTSILQLKNVFVPVPNASNYTYDSNPWRGSVDAPLASNLQWDVYSDGHGTLLVKMLFNEKETDFKAACDGARYAAGSAYYDYSKLKTCYGHVAL